VREKEALVSRCEAPIALPFIVGKTRHFVISFVAAMPLPWSMVRDLPVRGSVWLLRYRSGCSLGAPIDCSPAIAESQRSPSRWRCRRSCTSCSLHLPDLSMPIALVIRIVFGTLLPALRGVLLKGVGFAVRSSHWQSSPSW
jgi:hypothetical protein